MHLSRPNHDHMVFMDEIHQLYSYESKIMKTIMIIDDNKNYRVHLKRLLTLEDYATLEAEDGLLGLDAIHKYSPHLILCDMDMPVMDGMEVLRSVMELPR